jgi:hypothetical protein
MRSGNRAKPHILLICEGNEEERYIVRLLQLGAFSESYLLETRNASGAYNIPALFQDALSDYYFDAIFAMFDVDNPRHYAYDAVTKGLAEILGASASLYPQVHTNPCTMQLMLLHVGMIKIDTSDKTLLTPIIQHSWPAVKDIYQAHAYQLSAIAEALNLDNYGQMKQRLLLIGTEPLVCPSSNFGSFIQKLENPDSSWVGEYRRAIGR